jgi:hypothetical protein
MFQFFRVRRLLAIAIPLLILGQSAAFAQVAWVRNLDTALKQAAKEKKFVVLDFSATW